MKIRALEQVRKFEGGISLYNASSVDLKLNKIVNKGYSIGGTLGSDTYIYAKSDDSTVAKSRRSHVYRQYRPLSLEEKIPIKKDKGYELISGVIVYTSMKALAKFLKENIFLDYETQLTDFIKTSEGTNGKISADVIFERIRDNNDFVSIFSDVFVNTEKMKERDRSFEKITYNGKDYILERREERGASSVLIVKKRNISRSGHDIPVIDYIFTYNVEDRSLGGGDAKNTVLTYNQGRMKVYDSINNVNRGFVEYMEGGECLGESLLDIIPDNLTEVFCIVKVPTKTELEGCEVMKKTYDFLNKPFFVESSLKPILIPENVEVIDDPAVFKEIAGRLTAKIYVPSSVPVKINPSLMPEGSDYILLLRPAA